MIINGYPTRVEMCYFMVHEGSFSATIVSQSISVRTNAIKRLVRPVCFQGFPQELLTAELRDKNTVKFWRLVDGKLTKNSI